MEIISHRGYWLAPVEKNAVVAFERSFRLGYGTETDVRDYAGRLVISHDMPSGNELSLDGLLHLTEPSQPTLALNVKADGLAQTIARAMRERNYRRWFVFDMSIPDTIQQLAAKNPVFMRMSEHEMSPAFLDVAMGVWLDAFIDDAWRIAALSDLLARNKRVCLVSPELHRRAHEPFWERLREARLQSSELLILCTDFPEEANAFFASCR